MAETPDWLSTHDGAAPPAFIGPFGPSRLVQRMATRRLAHMYMEKCGLDISGSFFSQEELALYRCETTGMQFWWPREAAGGESFYHAVSKAWPSYYRPWRWEYGPALRRIPAGAKLLEIGCGQGYFLREAEARASAALGLEFNREAIATKVTRCEVLAQSIEEFADAHPDTYDVVCTFQVLEHVRDPASFLRACLRCARPGGTILVSVPNHECVDHAAQRDAFDLPPHHMSHFTPAALSRIAQQLGADAEETLVQPRRAALEEVTAATGRSLAYRVAARLAKLSLDAAYAMAREPGHTMLCVLRKRTA